MKKIYIVGGKWSTVGDKLIYEIQERELCRRGFLLTSNINDADIVLIGGGGTLYSRTGRRDEEYNGRFIDYPLKDLLKFRDTGKSIYISGAGFQDFEGEMNQGAWKEVLLAAKNISVRDNASAEAIRPFIGNKPISVWPDMAFNLKVIPTKPILDKTLVVAIGQEGLSPERKLAYEALLVALKSSYNFLWVPFDNAEFHCYQDYWIPKFGGELLIDEIFAGQFYIPDVAATIGAFQRCSGIISTRLHALLLAIMVNRPILHGGKNKFKVAAQAKDLFGEFHYPGLVSMQEPVGTLVEKAHTLFHGNSHEVLFQRVYMENHAKCLNHFNFLEEIR